MAREVEQLLQRLAALMPTTSLPDGGQSKQRDLFRDFDFPTRAALEECAARAAKLLAKAMPIPQMAERVGVNEDVIRKQIRKGAIYAIKAGKLTVVPTWQIREGRVVGGLKWILDALPQDLHPLEVEGFMRTEQDALRDDYGRPLTPLKWISDGRPVDTVATLASGVDKW